MCGYFNKRVEPLLLSIREDLIKGGYSNQIMDGFFFF